MARQRRLDRLFFALEPSQSLQTRLLTRQEQLAVLDGRPVPGPNFHLTLLFVGEVAPSITHQLMDLAIEFTQQPFAICYGEALFWPRQGIVALSAEPRAQLMSLHRTLRQACAPLVSLRKEREFTPHLTLLWAT